MQKKSLERNQTRENDFSLQQIVLQHLFSKLVSQHDYMVNLRNQAGMSATIAGLIATFFGIFIGSNPKLLLGDFIFGMNAFSMLAMVFFAGSIGCAVAVGVHHKEFFYFFNTSKMLEYADKDEGTFYSKYTEDGEWYFEDNEKKIIEAQSILWFAMILAFAQIIPWIVVIKGKVDG